MMPRSNFARFKEKLLRRWSEEDFPGATPRFQLGLLAKDIVIFGILPIASIILYKMVETTVTAPQRPRDRPRSISKYEGGEKPSSQIIDFRKPGSGGGKLGFSKRNPGTLVRVRLMNVVETYSNAPVHAQIVDGALGGEFLGGTLIGSATPEASAGRIKIDFKFVRHPKRLDVAVPISARAISLDGTFGLEATKKEGFFARSAIRSAATNKNAVDTSAKDGDFKTLIARAVAAGIMQEFESDASVAHNNGQLLTLQPLTEFYVELMDFFPGPM